MGRHVFPIKWLGMVIWVIVIPCRKGKQRPANIKKILDWIVCCTNLTLFCGSEIDAEQYFVYVKEWFLMFFLGEINYSKKRFWKSRPHFFSVHLFLGVQHCVKHSPIISDWQWSSEHICPRKHMHWSCLLRKRPATPKKVLTQNIFGAVKGSIVNG